MEEQVQQYLEGVDYPANKEELVSGNRDNDAPQDFIKRLVDLQRIEYSDHNEVAVALENFQHPE